MTRSSRSSLRSETMMNVAPTRRQLEMFVIILSRIQTSLIITTFATISNFTLAFPNSQNNLPYCADVEPLWLTTLETHYHLAISQSHNPPSRAPGLWRYSCAIQT
ncbi:uncharacterized protein BDV14DRAFT_27930 [Aspergillus stella-maris]|uniref:uncharacterized protein n=1 Tax=Aspergillus stella-maris TaxID=1810926 RepID=UPI003CCD67CF